MNKFSKLFLFLSLFLFVILGSAVPNGFCGSQIEDFRKSAEKGNAKAQYRLGLEYGSGKEVPEDLVEAVKWFRKAAEQGHADAQYYLGFAYAVGQGVPEDQVEAVKWTRKAAEQGHVNAQFYLGGAYAHGKGVPKDDVEAVKWYRKAADQGHAEAQFNLAVAYRKGEGVSKNFAEAVKWFRKAAEKGDSDAQLGLSGSYYYGEGVPKDEIEALAWLNIAAATGHQQAATTRGTLEKQLGQQASLLAQQRSKEILKEIEFAKQPKTKKEATAQTQPKKPTENAGPKGSGTGAFVTDDGLILTAAHVVAKSTKIKVLTKQGLKDARVVKLDNANDLALLKCEGSFQPAPMKSSSGTRLGQSVFTIGFPNIEFQGFSPKMTKGEISSLSGLRDDPRHWQISAPVQPGNSGGPLFDEAGNLIGVVLSKLDAMKVAKFTGDMPQNVNYAVKSVYALPLLEPYSANLAPKSEASSSPKNLENIVERVQGAVVLILVY